MTGAASALPAVASDTPPEAASLFLRILDPVEPEFEFRTFGEGAATNRRELTRVLRGTLHDCHPMLAAANRNGASVCVQVNRGKRGNAGVTGVRAFGFDADKVDPAEVRAALTRAGIVPHIEVQTSPGRGHLYVLVSDCPVPRFKAIMRSLAKRLGTDPAVCDPSRVLRLPGYFNNKRDEPFMVELVSTSNHSPYTTKTVLDAFGIVVEEPPQATPIEFLPEANTRFAYERGREYAATAAPAIQGQGKGGTARTIEVAQRLMDYGNDVPAATAIMSEVFNSRCEPPFDENELAGLAQRARDCRVMPVGRLTAAFEFEPIDPATLELIDAISARHSKPAVSAANKAGGLLFTLESARATRFRETPKPRDWTTEGLLLKGRAAILAGPGGVSKSTLANLLSLCIANGVPLFGQFACPQGAVLIFNAEDDEGELHRRFWYLRQATSLSLDNVYAVPRVGMSNLLTDGPSGALRMTELAHAIVASAAQIPNLRLIVIDPLARWRGGDENAAPDATRIVEVKEHIAAQTGAAVLSVQHANKAADGRVDAGQAAVRGSSALVDGVRAALRLRPMTADEARLRGWPRERAAHFVEFTAPKLNYGPPVRPTWLQRMGSGMLVPVDLESLESERQQSKADAAYADVLAKVLAHVERGAKASRRTLEREHAGLSGLFGVTAHNLRSILARAVEQGDLIELTTDGGAILAAPERDK